MIQDSSSSHSAPLSQDDELQFEPTLSVDVAQLTQNQVDSEEDGEHVRDEDLMTGDEAFVSSDPFPAPRRSQQVLSGTSAKYYQPPINGVDGSPRRSVPPPLVPPPPLMRPAEFRSRPSRPPQFPAFGGRAAESPNFGDRPVEPATSVRRATHSSRHVESFARNTDRLVLERPRPQRREILREGDLLLGKLRIERVVSEGLLVTAEAVHLGLGTRAQVVLLSPHGAGFANAQEHFVRTARIVAQMQSEHVARVTEVGSLESGAPFVVTEMLGHSDLGELLRVRGPIAVSDAVDYSIQIAEAFAEAHSLGVIHGNLRPSSLRMSEGVDGWPLIKVLGYGAMAQWSLGSVSVRAAGHRGGPAASSALPYLSPEQIRSPGDLDTRTDLWSLGAILHEMLVGWPVYQADSAAALLAMIAADPPSRITAQRADVPRQLESVILRCLEKDRGARYASVAELARALQPFAPPECHATVERIVRVMARGSNAPSPYSRPHNAMVHVRSYNAVSTGPFESRGPARSVPTLRLGVILGVVGMGTAAGVGSAVFFSQMMSGSSLAGKASDAAKQAGSEFRREPIAAANPGQVSSPTTGAAPFEVTSNVVAATPVVPSTINPSAVREMPRPAVTVQRRPPVLVSTPQASHKEARADKAESRSTTKATDLFGDIK